MEQGLSAEYWSERYRNGETGWDTGTVTTPLKTYFDQLQDKKISILIPGAGNAHEAEYLFNAGFHNVFVCDLAAEPLQNLSARCPAFPESQLLMGNFFDLDQTFDLIIEQTFFCALDPSLRPAYFSKMAELLNPGGHLVGVLFSEVVDGPPPFGGSKEEYVGYIKAPFRIKTLDTCYNSIKPRQGRELFINLEMPRSTPSPTTYY